MLRSTWPTTRSPDRTTGWSLLDAVTLFLSARLMARFADKKDPHVVSAFSKLARVLPTPLAAHVHATVAAMQEGQVCRTDRSIDAMRGCSRLWRPCGPNRASSALRTHGRLRTES